jgi:hypothetical protein
MEHMIRETPAPAYTGLNDGASKISSRFSSILKRAIVIAATCVILYGSYSILADRVLLLAKAQSPMLPKNLEHLGCSDPTTTIPQYFQTSPELWAGPTATGRAPFLAQTNPVSFDPTATFVPTNPLETAMPVMGQSHNESIFKLMAHLSPYFSNPDGFGIGEYPLPPGAKIQQVQVSRLETVML